VKRDNVKEAVECIADRNQRHRDRSSTLTCASYGRRGRKRCGS